MGNVTSSGPNNLYIPSRGSTVQVGESGEDSQVSLDQIQLDPARMQPFPVGKHHTNPGETTVRPVGWAQSRGSHGLMPFHQLEKKVDCKLDSGITYIIDSITLAAPVALLLFVPSSDEGLPTNRSPHHLYLLKIALVFLCGCISLLWS